MIERDDSAWDHEDPRVRLTAENARRAWPRPIKMAALARDRITYLVPRARRDNMKAEVTIGGQT
jgi:hypothetical protein